MSIASMRIDTATERRFIERRGTTAPDALGYLDEIDRLSKHVHELTNALTLLHAVHEGFRDHIDRLRAERRWVPCTERLPAGNDQVLVIDKRGLRFLAWHGPFAHNWHDTRGGILHGVEAWMALPEVPGAPEAGA